MIDNDFHQRYLGPLRAAAEAAELGQAVIGLLGIGGMQRAMNTALGGVLRAFGDAVAPFGSGGAWLVTCRQGTEAGR